MPTGTANLMENIYDLLSGLYTPSTAGTAFLAFEKLGVPISTGMFKLQPTDAALSPALGVERVSEIANAVLTAEADSVVRSNRTIDNMIELLLLQATPVSADQLQTLGAAKNSANLAFDSTLASLEGAFRYHPVYASPADWYDPQASGNWTLHTVGQQQGPAPAPPPSPAPRPIRVDPPRWRVLPTQMQPALAQPVAQTHPFYVATSAQRPVPAELFRVATTIAGAPHPPVAAARPAMATMARVAISPAAFRSAAVVQPSAPPAPQVAAPASGPTLQVAAQSLRPLALAFATAQLNATATAQPVAADSVDISFEHCVVTLARHWFPQIFLMIKNWYVPGYQSGSFSAGSGIGDTGMLPILAGGFVVIRNLRISAKWSAQDLAAVQGAAAFGPFSLVGRTYDAGSGTLICPGMQIIGWFCEALPVLPPASDPAMSGATPTVPSTSGDGATTPASTTATSGQGTAP